MIAQNPRIAPGYAGLPADLRLLRPILRVVGRGHRLARRLWRGRLENLGVVCLATRFGFQVLLEPRDYMAWAIAMHENHEPLVTRLLLESAHGKDAFVDVGANYGWFSLLAATRLSSTGGKVFAYEPQPALCQLLRRSAELNRLDNLTVIEAAAGEHRSRGVLSVPVADRSGFTSVKPTGAARDPVRIVTLDEEFRDGTPAVVKIDTEGSELRVLRGMSRLLATAALRSLLIEVHPPLIKRLGDDCAELFATLVGHGFRLLHIAVRHPGEEWLTELAQPLENVACYNLLATRE
jgi:FkbM family methyltransferase